MISMISITLSVIALWVVIFVSPAAAYPNYISNSTLSPIFDLDTRTLTNHSLPFSSALAVNSTLTKFGSGCPPEIAIYIHGFNRNDEEAKEEFNRLQTSLIHNNYRIPLVGYSWESNVLWLDAIAKAKSNGPMLAQYIITLHNDKVCPNTEIRILAHSLGAAIVDETLLNLANNSDWRGRIASVHLLGAAIDNKRLENNSDLSTAAKATVAKFYNLYNPEDDGLTLNQALYRAPIKDVTPGIKDYASLGLVGAPKGSVHPNYNDTNVEYEIPPISDADGDGIVEECFEDVNIAKLWGDNHCGYIGFRNPVTGLLSDDGAMDIVVRDWLKK